MGLFIGIWVQITLFCIAFAAGRITKTTTFLQPVIEVPVVVVLPYGRKSEKDDECRDISIH